MDKKSTEEPLLSIKEAVEAFCRGCGFCDGGQCAAPYCRYEDPYGDP